MRRLDQRAADDGGGPGVKTKGGWKLKTRGMGVTCFRKANDDEGPLMARLELAGAAVLLPREGEIDGVGVDHLGFSPAAPGEPAPLQVDDLQAGVLVERQPG